MAQVAGLPITGHPRRLTRQQIHDGMGQFPNDGGKDFPQHLREYLARQIESAYNAGRIRRCTDKFELAARLGVALRADTVPMMEALRVNLNLDGRELKKAVQSLVPLVPAIGDPVNGLVRWM